MTRKDYIIIAEVLKNFKQYDKEGGVSDPIEYLVNEFGYQLQKQNSSFDIVKFKKAVNAN